MNKTTLAKALLCTTLLASLSGCVALMVGGAAAGAAATVDRRTLGAQTEDKAISVKADLRLPNVAGPDSHVNLYAYNRQVLLTGEVKDASLRAAVEKEAKAIDGVGTVSNEITIGGPATYTARSNDALITAKVKASLVDMKTITATSFKVVTDKSVVYLMGRVTQREGQVAADVARSVNGVSKVVKILEYITEDELRALSPQSKVQL